MSIAQTNLAFSEAIMPRISKYRKGGLGWKCYKLGCDDHCTTINVINSLSNIKKEDKEKGCNVQHDT